MIGFEKKLVVILVGLGLMSNSLLRLCFEEFFSGASEKGLPLGASLQLFKTLRDSKQVAQGEDLGEHVCACQEVGVAQLLVRNEPNYWLCHIPFSLWRLRNARVGTSLSQAPEKRGKTRNGKWLEVC